jgi:TolB-like protein
MRGFFEELRYRNVLRVGAAYVIAGWLLAQVADLAADAFNAPEWFMQMLIVLLLIGLPVVLFLAWIYELTPEGVKKAKDLPADMPKDPRSGKTLNRLTLAALIIAVGWLSWDKFQQPEHVARGPAQSVDKSIAVLPFADFSPDGDHAWFADGLTDEILNALARTRSLRVASRTSSFAYRDTEQDATEIASELNVAHILEGSVRRAGERIRITAQLIRASDDAHLWSETFDARSDDSIEIQERIAFEIASLLDTAMDPNELRRMVAAGTESISAWEAYVQMREVYFPRDRRPGPSVWRGTFVVCRNRRRVAEPGERHGRAARVVGRRTAGLVQNRHRRCGSPCAQRRRQARRRDSARPAAAAAHRSRRPDT